MGNTPATIIQYKTTFRVADMDCAAEENLINMKLGGMPGIQSLQFDLPGRLLTVYHTSDAADILSRLETLHLGASTVSTETVALRPKTDTTPERKLLWQVLLLNFFFFVLELLTGFIFHSMGLVADGLDMLADSLVYGLALFAVGGSIVLKKNIARLSGYLQLLLAVLGFVEVLRRFTGHGEVPSYGMMILISCLALTGNAISLYLLQKSKSTEHHIRASMIFTSNDVIVNIGVITAGALVYLTNSNIPDLLIGTLVFSLVARGAFRILSLAKE